MTETALNRSVTERTIRGATRHSAVLIGALVAIFVLNYIFGVALSWFFTPAQFGVLGVAQSLLLLTALVVGSGFAWTTAHDVASSGVTDETRLRFRTAWLANTALGLLLGGGLWTAYMLGWIPLGPAYRAVVPLISLTTVLLAARSVLNGAARGAYHFGPLAVNQVFEVVVKASAGLVLVAVGAGVGGVMAGFAIGTTAALAHSLWITRPAHLWRGQGWANRHVLTATAPLFLGLLGTALMLNLDILGLKLFAPSSQADELAGFYQAAVILARSPVFVAQSLSLVLFSYIARAQPPAQGTHRAAADHMEVALRSWLRLLLPVGLALALAPQSALSLFFPADYQTAAPALRIAAGGGALLALVTLLTVALQAAGDRRRPALAAALATATQIAVLIWLVPHWGPQGAAWSLLAAGAVALLSLAPALKTHFGSLLSRERIRVQPHLYRVVLPLLALAIPLVVLPGGERGAAFLKLGLTGLSYLAALLATHSWSVNDSDRPIADLFGQFVHILMGG